MCACVCLYVTLCCDKKFGKITVKRGSHKMTGCCHSQKTHTDVPMERDILGGSLKTIVCCYFERTLKNMSCCHRKYV